MSSLIALAIKAYPLAILRFRLDPIGPKCVDFRGTTSLRGGRLHGPDSAQRHRSKAETNANGFRLFAQKSVVQLEAVFVGRGGRWGGRRCQCGGGGSSATTTASSAASQWNRVWGKRVSTAELFPRGGAGSASSSADAA